jgi:sporulation protein YlmC with PRC-barrel domain
MSKPLMIGAAAGALMLSAAIAQTPRPPSTYAPPAAAQSAPTDQGSANKADIVMSQKPDQWLASRFKGTHVLGADGKAIGNVSDILFDKTGKIEAYVISVGGFLGMGAKEVAMAPDSFQVVPGPNGGADQLRIALNKDELMQAQNFTRYEPPHLTTGSAPGGGMPNGLRPSTNTPPTSR